MFVKIIFIHFLISFVIAEKDLTIVLDTSGSMREEIRMIQEKIAPVLKKINNKKINNYLLVSYSDPNDRSNIQIDQDSSLTRIGLLEHLKSVDIKWEGSSPRISLEAIENALENSKPESYIYVFTDAQAKDYNRLDNVQRLCRKQLSQVFIFLSANYLDSDINEEREKVYFEIAKSCNGFFIKMDINNFQQAFWLIKEISNVDWTEVSTHSAFLNHRKYNFTVDGYTENLIAAVSCQSPSLEILNDSEKRPTMQIIMVTQRALIINVMQEMGDYSIDINCQGTGTVTFYRRKTIKFKYGFSPLPPRHLDETSSRPLPLVKTYILVVLRINYNAEVFSILLQSDQGTKELEFRAIDEEKRQYIAETAFNPDYSYKILIFCKDKTSGEIVTGQSNTIIPQQSVSPEKLVIPFGEKILLEPPLIVYGTSFTFSCKVIGYPEPEIWWENENGDKMPSKHALLETFVYISYATIDNATVNSTVFCKSKNLGGENTLTINYYINRTYSFEVIQIPSNTTVEYDKEGKLYCEVDAYPKAAIKWRHNDTDIEESENIQLISDEHMLRINRMSLDDTGEYICEAENEVESRTFAASVYVTGLDPPQIDIGITEIILHPDDMKELTCNVIKGTPIPELKWKYKRNLGAELSDLPDGVITEGNSIEIASATVKHAGVYVCEATNILGADAAEVIIKVQYAPKIKNDDEVRTVKNTHQVELACDVDAEPPAEVHWYMSQDDVIIDFDERHYTDQEHKHHFTASSNDSGVYHCVAENSIGIAVRTVTINVLVKPYIEPVRRRKRVRTGDSVTLPCNVLEGNPLPATRVEFTDINRIKSVLLSGNTTGKLDLSLRNISKQNEGTYLCVAENAAGIDTITVFLEVD